MSRVSIRHSGIQGLQRASGVQRELQARWGPGLTEAQHQAWRDPGLTEGQWGPGGASGMAGSPPLPGPSSGRNRPLPWPPPQSGTFSRSGCWVSSATQGRLGNRAPGAHKVGPGPAWRQPRASPQPQEKATGLGDALRGQSRACGIPLLSLPTREGCWRRNGASCGNDFQQI